MSSNIFTIEKVYNAPVEKVWKAITCNDDMKKWYFDLSDFKPEIGFEFRFKAGRDENHLYEHVCKITEVIPERKLQYSWKYVDYEGDSLVTFELFKESADKTRLVFSHVGLDTFPKNNKDFAKESFEEGWTHITGKSLKAFVESSE